VLGIAAGGVPVAAELARRLGLSTDVAVVSKITLPWSSEAGYGAVAFDGSVKLNESLVESLGLTQTIIEAGVVRTREKVERRLRALRGGTSYGDLRRATVVVVDDGLASGFTMLAAVDALAHIGAGTVIVAVPTASESAVGRVATEVSALYCANLRSGRVFAVADAYRRWEDVDEEELARYVAELGKERASGPIKRWIGKTHTRS
jgi:predicted phosphoribosyltransferase